MLARVFLSLLSLCQWYVVFVFWDVVATPHRDVLSGARGDTGSLVIVARSLVLLSSAAIILAQAVPFCCARGSCFIG